MVALVRLAKKVSPPNLYCRERINDEEAKVDLDQVNPTSTQPEVESGASEAPQSGVS